MEEAGHIDGWQALVKVHVERGLEEHLEAQSILLVASAGPEEDWAGVEEEGAVL